MSHDRNYFHDTFSPASLVGAAIISTAGAVVAQDWPSGTTSGLSSNSPRIVQFDSQVGFAFNISSTYAAIPTTNSSGTTASSGRNVYQAAGHQHTYRIPSSSTGYSLTAPTSGAITISFWDEA